MAGIVLKNLNNLIIKLLHLSIDWKCVGKAVPTCTDKDPKVVECLWKT
jgi:hypothetical protein